MVLTSKALVELATRPPIQVRKLVTSRNAEGEPIAYREEGEYEFQDPDWLREGPSKRIGWKVPWRGHGA
jgi:hypothetical protein